MAWSRTVVETKLNALRDRVPALRREYADDGDFWNAFAGEAEVIEDGASSADIGYVRERLDSMLAENGLHSGSLE